MPVTSRYADDALTLHPRSAVLDLPLAPRSVRQFAPGVVTDAHARMDPGARRQGLLIARRDV